MRVNTERVLLAWSPGLEEVCGYTEAEVLGRKVDFLTPRMPRAKQWQAFTKAVAAGQMRQPNKTFRVVGVHKDGHTVAFRSIDILNFAEDGSVESVTAITLRWTGCSRRPRPTEPTHTNATLGPNLPVC